jgi:hypothetical protein
MRTTRRTLLKLVGAVVAAAWLEPAAAQAAERRALDALARLFGDRDAIRSVGRTCTGVAGCADRSAALRRIAADLDLSIDGLAKLRPGTLGRRLARAIRRDFADGRVVTVDGWVLAETEARLYAIAATAR